MHLLFLYLHSWNRWLLIFLGLLFLLHTTIAKIKQKPLTKTENILSRSFLISLDTQFLLGLILYGFFSPEVKAAFANWAFAMKQPLLRFYAVEHLFTALLALIFLHVGNVLARKKEDTNQKRNIRLVFFGLAFVLVLLTIPWPFREILARPLFRF